MMRSGVAIVLLVCLWESASGGQPATVWHPADKRTATEPHIPAPMTFAAYLANEDPALLAIGRQP